MNTDMIPNTLRELPQWVLWSSERRGGELTKLPKQVTGAMASSTNPETWTTFDDVIAAYTNGTERFSGPGFVFVADGGLCGIDLDGCRNKETGELSQWAKEWVLKLNSYAEVSPSGTGVKIFVKGSKPTWCGSKTAVAADHVPGDKEPGVEIYDRGRYFALTSKRLQGMPTEPQDRQAEINQFCEAFFKRPVVAPVTITRDFGSEAAIIDRARLYIKQMPPAISGQDGHKSTFKVACVLVKGFGLSREDGLALLTEWNQTHCEPAWDERQLEHKIDSAIKAPGETNYLRLTRQHEWERVRIPRYEEAKPKSPRNFITSAQATTAFIERLRKGDEDLTPTGIEALDYAIGGGVARPESIVFAAPSNHCKSSFGLQMIHSFASRQKKCHIISSEMSAHLLGKRTLQTVLGDLPQNEWKENLFMLETAEHVYLEHRAEWYIDDDAHNIDEVLQSIDQAVDEHGVELVVVDYLQMIEATAKNSNTYEKVSMVSDALRKKVKDKNITLLALSQLNRDIERRPKFQPKNSDIKDSSRIVQDADVIIFGVWPHKVDETKPMHLYDFYISKNRNRSIESFNVQVRWDGAKQTFSDLLKRAPVNREWSIDE